jgi:hypothetical protein
MNVTGQHFNQAFGDLTMQPTIYAPSTEQLIRFLGDSETGIVHYAQGGCEVDASEAFLDLRTAIVRGYRICACCH